MTNPIHRENNFHDLSEWIINKDQDLTKWNEILIVYSYPENKILKIMCWLFKGK